MSSRSSILLAGRLGYRFASALIKLDWRIRPSRGRGVKMIVERGDGAILLVRHTYGSRHWTLPGGRMRRSEDPVTAAARELGEELSLIAGEISHVGNYPLRVHRRRERIDVVRCRMPVGQLVPREMEIAKAGWFDIADLPPGTDPQVTTATGLLEGHLAELQVL